MIETNCAHRETSTVASQALTLLNSDFMHRQAEALAERVLKEENPPRRAMLLAFGRSATAKEEEALRSFVDLQTQHHAKTLAANHVPEARRRALADLCHMLLSANEFAYID